jgi:energy-coupling factor transport system ATP-binding protein
VEEVAFIENLRLKFPGDDTLLFKDLTVSFKKGEKVLLLGPSGCGKSTLLQTISGLIPKSIEVPIKYSDIQYPESWGYVFQDPDSQFCMPYVDEELAFVLENLKVPRCDMPKRIEDLLIKVGLPLDQHTPIQTLSGGMKQRLAIASVLALDPECLFLDEPSALIDEEGTKQIWETVKEVAKDKTVLIVEHKIDQILDFVERVIVFNQEGEIIADDDVHTVFSLFRKQLQQYGIWYPGVWDNYVRPFAKNENQTKHEHRLILESFKGYRKKEVKIQVEKASVESGEWIAVIGDNGAGKSTLLLSLMQLIKTSGAFQLNGETIKTIKQLQQQAYFVFQNPEYQFITNSVYEEIAYALKLKKESPTMIKRRVEELLAIFGLTKKQNHHPYHLSLGQKRRLSVATAFVENPKLLLLDEPTFGQDSKNTFHLLELLEVERQKGSMIIMVTHDSEIVKRFATRVWEIHNGMVTKDYQHEFVQLEKSEVAYAHHL